MSKLRNPLRRGPIFPIRYHRRRNPKISNSLSPKLKLARCPQSLTASLAANLSKSHLT